MIRSIEWLFKLVYRYAKKYMLFEVTMVVLAGSLAPISTLALQWMIDSITYKAEWKLALFSYIGILLLREVVLSLKNFFSAKIQYSLSHKRAEDIVEKFNLLEYYLFEEKESKDILKKISENPFEPLFNLYQDIISIVSDSIAVVGYIFVVGQVHWLLSAGYLLFLMMDIWTSFRAVNLMTDLYDAQTKEERRMDYLSDLLMSKDTLAELKVFNSVSYIVGKWKELASTVFIQRLRVTMRSQFSFAMGSLLSIVWMGVLIFIVVKQLTMGRIEIGIFVAVINCSASLISLSEALSNYGVAISKKISVVHQYKAFEKLPEVCYDNRVYQKHPYEGGIEFKHVTFKYPNSEKVILNDLSFSIQAGETVALAGENGAGKSTILKLLCGLYQPQSGCVLIDGQDVRSIKPSELSRLLGVAFQDFERYSFSLRENIALGKIEEYHDDTQIREALHFALADNLSENLDMQLGKLEDRGTDLSGGQWQRVAVARALFGQKNI